MHSASRTAVEPSSRGAASPAAAAESNIDFGAENHPRVKGVNFPKRMGAWCRRCHCRHRAGHPEAVVARCGGQLEPSAPPHLEERP